MAAGLGNRMRPVTDKTPKPMVKVNGVRMIESIIDGLHQQKITEIYIVVGYLSEQFNVLKEKYDGITLIKNPYYASCNNISSLYVAREYLEDVIILDGDQIVNNSRIFSREFDRSGYNAIWTDSETSEWIMTVNEDGIVTDCSRTGGPCGWQLYSVSRWSKEDGERLRRHLEIEFEQKKNTQIYWDDIALFCYPDQYCLGIRQMNRSDILEIDNLDELIAVDSSYQKFRRI